MNASGHSSAVPARLVALGLCLIGSGVEAAPPAWWAARGATDNAAAEDYAILNLGQLKWMATKAKEELDAFLPGGAGAAVNALVDSWSTLQANGTRIPIVSSQTEDYAIANLGQLKAVAQPFYDRLIATGLATSYPWQNSSDPAEDYAIANVGQLKSLFSFSRDSDGDEIDDLWELQVAGNLTQIGATDSDNDGVTDLFEFATNTSPIDPAPTLTLLDPAWTSLLP